MTSVHPPAPIAIIGIGCRLPGGTNSASQFWQLLSQGVDAIQEIPADRWDMARHFDPDPTVPERIHIRHGGFVEDIDRFDAKLFGISPREALCMDPQQRLLLEVAWQAIEDGGQSATALAGETVGVFMGISASDYSNLLWDGDTDYQQPPNEPYVLPGNTGCIAAYRISHAFDFKGPSLTVDTACSSSLVAVHLACESLWRGESRLALAGGVQALLHVGVMRGFCKAGLLSPDGRCRSFDATANGYVRSEGAGAVLLKPLAEAIANRDPIYAVIRGTAVNSDGRSNGMVAPDAEAQMEAVRQAFARAGIDPACTQYVEAHGTGTRLGDPVELKALGTVLGEGRDPQQPCRVGSVKTNLGHSETAAGVTGLIKAALCIHHAQIPPSLHFHQPNPAIDFRGLKLEVQRELGPFPQPEQERIVGVSSFGFGGTNAHVVLSEAPAPERVSRYGAQPPRALLSLSAKTPEALQALASAYAEWLEQHPGLSLNDLCASAALRRARLPQRLVCVAVDRETLKIQLQAAAAGQSLAGIQSGQGRPRETRTVWMFTGQGSQWVGMGAQLYRHQPRFRAVIDRCAELLVGEIDLPLTELLFAEGVSAETARQRLEQTVYQQPVLFALELALAELWRSWGLEPELLLGHSIGEYVAACVAGVFSLEDGLRLVTARGRLMQSLPTGGGMLALLCDQERVKSLLQELSLELAIAAVNGPANVVVAGSLTALAELQAKAEQRGLLVKPLAVSHAFHSPAMDPILADFERVASSVTLQRPRIPLVSTLTGRLETTALTDPAYWCEHLRQPVQFAAALETALTQGAGVLLEVGARPVLLGMARFCLGDRQVVTLPSLQPEQDDHDALLQSLAQWVVQGRVVDWAGFYAPFPHNTVALPTYPFQRQRFWWKESAALPQTPVASIASTLPSDPLVLTGIPLAGTQDEARFGLTLDALSSGYLQDHCLRQQPVLPAAAFIELMLRALPPAEAQQLRDLVIEQPLKLTTEPISLQVVRRGDQLEIFSQTQAGDWQRHAQAIWQVVNPSEEPIVSVCLPDAGTASEPTEAVADFYSLLAEFGLRYGPAFQGIAALVNGVESGFWARIRRPAGLRMPDASVLHPALLDSCFQAIAATLDSRSDLYLPVGLHELQVLQPLPEQFWCRVERLPAVGGELQADLTLVGDEGQILVQIGGFRLRRVPRQALDWLLGETATPEASLQYVTEWERLDWSCLPDLPAEPGCWLLVGTSSELVLQLEQLLQAEGDQVLRLDPAAVALLQSGCWQPWLAQLPAELPLKGVLFLAGLEAHDLVSAEPVLAGLLHLTQALLERPKLRWLVATCGAQSVRSDCTRPAQALLWGFTHVLASEQPGWRCLRLDLDPQHQPQAEQLLNLLLDESPEERQAIRGGDRYVARLRPLQPVLQAPAGQPFRLRMRDYGLLENLHLDSLVRQPPAPREVELQVLATGLNFRDVLNALGLLRAYSVQLGLDAAIDVPFGGECVARVVRRGRQVAELEDGQVVIAALAVGCLASHVTVPADFCVPLPADLSPEDGATVATAFLTAHYGLRELARLQPGETVLIHAAAGGVGQAALQIARRCGARVLATASRSKWDGLLAQGAEAVFDSRSLGFADAVLRHTQGRGVDVVLNSLKGEFCDRSFDCLAQGGRFLELGKLDIWTLEQAAERRPDARYHPFDLLEVGLADPPHIQVMLRQLMDEFARGELQPLPRHSFPLAETVEAFRFMAQARHVGKVVITLPEAETEAVAIRTDGSYLITGAFGGLGRQLAEWLVGQGAQDLVLVGRNNPGDDALQWLQSLEQQGARVQAIAADISRTEDCQTLFAQLGPSPLRGIIHAAGVLDDGPLVSQTWDRFQRVLSPKVQGWENLNRFAPAGLDFRVAFSSLAVLLGSPAQSNYAAANAYLDASAAMLRQRGERAISIAWGPWEGAGMAGRLEESERQRFTALGIDLLSPVQALDAFGDFLGGAIANPAAMQVDWNRLLNKLPPDTRCFLQELATGADTAVASAYREELLMLPASERLDTLIGYLQQQLAKVMSLEEPASVETQEPLFNLGLDSLMALELNNLLEQNLGISLTQTVVFEYPTLEKLAGYILGQLLMDDPGSQPSAVVPHTIGISASENPNAAAGEGVELEAAVAEISRLSDEELLRQLMG